MIPANYVVLERGEVKAWVDSNNSISWITIKTNNTESKNDITVKPAHRISKLPNPLKPDFESRMKM